jgi:hypothetical protein
MREDEPHNVDETAAREAVYNEIRHAAIHFCRATDTEKSPNTQDQAGLCSVAPVEQSSLPQMVEGRLHLVEMRMLASTHPFVFGAQKGSFISLPRLQNG